ncbi:hypothetical protein DSECCO2_629600 [anaerobic digester metagenome]
MVINKNLTFTGIGINPEDTVIQFYSDDGATFTITSGVAVVLENLSIWNHGSGLAVENNGMLTIINCFVNGNYIDNEVTGVAAGGTTETLEETTLTETSEEATLTETSEETTLTETSEETGLTTETMLLTSEEGTKTGTTDSTEVMGETFTTGTEDTFTTSTEETTTTDDPAIPLASLASGMLMVMGGTVVSGRKHH